MSAPTLIIGLGGTGSDIVGRVMDKLGDDRQANVAFVVFDTDANDLRLLKNKYPSLKTVQTSPAMTVEECLSAYDGWEEWFPVHPVLMPKDLTQGAGQVRAISRLAFETIVQNGKIEPLHEAIKSLHGISNDSMEQAVRVVIVSTIAGGTGSGLVLPLALYLRNYFKTVFHKNSVIIRGQFVMPDVLTSTVIRNDDRQKRFLEANAYATIREIDAFIRKGDGFNINEDYSAVRFDVPVSGTRRREEYPALLPYDFVFLTDAQNFSGKVLGDKETYYDYIATCIYAGTLTPVSSRSNSAEDNLIRETIRNNGRSRYCGSGVSRIVYPFEDVRDYIAFGWAEKSIADEWMRIDDEYLQACRDAEQRGENQPDQGEFYTDALKQKAQDGTPFFMTIYKQTYEVTESAFGGEEQVPKAESYVDALEDEIRRRVENVKRLEAARMKATEASSINRELAASAIINDANAYYNAAIEFYNAMEEASASLPRGMSNSLFSVANPEDRMKRKNDYDLEKWLTGASGDAIHPAASRYIIYESRQIIKERLDDARSATIKKKSELDDFRSPEHFADPETGERGNFYDRIASAVGTGSSDKGIGEKIAGALKRDDNGDASVLDSLLADVGEFTENIDAYFLVSTKQKVLEAALTFLDGIADSYDRFYGQIRREVSQIHRKREEIKQDTLYNATSETQGNKVLSSSVRYVCADGVCLERIEKQAFCPGNAAKLSPEVCGNIYRAVLKFYSAKERNQKQGFTDEETNLKASSFFSGAFESAILEYWRKELLDGQAGHLVDMDIIDALRAEGRYRRGYDEAEELDRYAEDVFNEGKILAEPMIENPHGIKPRSIDACLYSGSLAGSGESSKIRFVQSVLKSYNGVEDTRFSKREILVYKSLYGLCVNQIPKFTPTGSLNMGTQGGNYFKSYNDLVSGLGPVSKDNLDLTPHLDVRWHWPFAFPNIDENEELRQKNDVVRAFIFGLTFNKIQMRPAVPRNVYELVLKGSKDFVTSNGTPCDYFYEVFDALNINPPFVRELIEASQNSRDEEGTEGIASLAESRLVRNLGSNAFGATGQDAAAGRLYFRLPEFDTKETGEIRRSVFEIPLLFQLSAPLRYTSEKQVEQILDAVFTTLDSYAETLIAPDKVQMELAALYREQYLLFEKNLESIDETYRRNVAREKIVNTIRMKVKDWFDSAERILPLDRDNVDAAIEDNKKKWNDIFAERDEARFDSLVSQLD